MMQHLIVLPILLPMAFGIGLLLLAHAPLGIKRLLSLLSAIALLLVAGLLVEQASATTPTYTLGSWPAPFGIVLVADRLAALMVALMAVLLLPCIWFSAQGADTHSRDFHALMQFQVMGINGAFLTGDIFNLFVFFEVLLIASYALLLHGGGAQRSRAGLHYVVLNLVGSALFLIALGALYATLGTLNMADMARKIPELSTEQGILVRAGALILLVVFALKAGALPLYFWLPSAYSAASAPVAALFAIMTKVGIYAILRVFYLMFGPYADIHLGFLAHGWLWAFGLLTLGFGIIGVLGSLRLRRTVAYLVIMSVGTTLAALSVHTQAMLTGALYYLLHSTLVSAGLFLLADLIARQRDVADDVLLDARALAQPRLLGGMFLLGAIAVIGLPPLSGFIGKLLMLRAIPGQYMLLFWSALLLASLLSLVAMARAGSQLFWRQAEQPPGTDKASAQEVLATLLLLLSSPVLVGVAPSLVPWLQATSEQLLLPANYIQAVFPLEADAP